jgi:superfamily II DNA or RNA helicase
MANPTAGFTAPTTPLLDQLPLWPHQSEAIIRMRRYIADYQTGSVEGSALVHMPTGSGKTGVIATIARCLPEVGCTLILAPRIALRQQLVRDVESRFFNHLQLPFSLDEIPKQVLEITGDGSMPKVADYESTILIATIQKIYRMAHNAPEWDELVKHISLIVIDEGHYEPAASWSIVLRSFNAPKIIFTATPYRNDLKFFDINLDYVFSYTFHQAVEDGFLRDVEIIPQKPTRNPKKFVTDLLAFYDKNFSNTKGDKPRVIIRCDRMDEIRQIARILKDQKRDYIAIHERFSDTGKNLREWKSVPNPHEVMSEPKLPNKENMEELSENEKEKIKRLKSD